MFSCSIIIIPVLKECDVGFVLRYNDVPHHPETFCSVNKQVILTVCKNNKIFSCV
jgi:hypothetical protein